MTDNENVRIRIVPGSPRSPGQAGLTSPLLGPTLTVRFAEQQRRANWDACQFPKSLSMMLQSFQPIVWILFSLILPGLFGDSRETTCDALFDILHWVTMYMYFEALVIIELAIYMLIVYTAFKSIRDANKLNRFISTAQLVALVGYAAIYIVGLGVYFWVLIVMFLNSGWTNACIQGWYWLDLINLCFIICITSVFGMILVFGVIASIFYMPLVIKTLNGAYY